MDLIWGAISGSNLDLICDGSSRSLVPGRPKQPDERALRRLLQQPAVPAPRQHTTAVREHKHFNRDWSPRFLCAA